MESDDSRCIKADIENNIKDEDEVYSHISAFYPLT